MAGSGEAAVATALSCASVGLAGSASLGAGGEPRPDSMEREGSLSQRALPTRATSNQQPATSSYQTSTTIHQTSPQLVIRMSQTKNYLWRKQDGRAGYFGGKPASLTRRVQPSGALGVTVTSPKYQHLAD